MEEALLRWTEEKLPNPGRELPNSPGEIAKPLVDGGDRWIEGQPKAFLVAR